MDNSLVLSNKRKYKSNFIEFFFNILLFVFFIQRASSFLDVGGFLYYAVPLAMSIISFSNINKWMSKSVKSNRRYALWIIVFTSFCFLSYLWSNEYDGANSSFFIMNYVFMVPISMFLDSKKRVMTALKTIFLAILFIELYALTFGGLRLSFFENSLRLSNSNFNGNTMAILAIFAIFIAFINDTKTKKNYTIVIYAIVFVNLIIIFLSGSKKGLLMLFAGLLLFLTFRKKDNRLLRFCLILVLLVFAFAIFMNVSIFYNLIGIRVELFLKQLLYGSGDSSSYERISMISYGLAWFAQKPIFGWGIDTFKFNYVVVSKFSFFTYSHNNYVELLFGVGLVGTAIYYMLYFDIFRTLRINSKAICKNKELMFSLLFIATLLISEVALVTYSSRWVQIMLLLVYLLIKNVRENEDKTYVKV